jgi:hypothetical protein
VPVVKPSAPAPTKFGLHLGPAVGRADDFHVLGYCPDMDEVERGTHPGHRAFTYVLHYQPGSRTIVDRVNERIDGLWMPPQGPLVGVGDARGYLEIDAAGIREVALPQARGHFVSVWGVGVDHLFVCGMYPASVLYRRFGTWLDLPLPEGTRDLYGVHGLSADEVYFVGEEGQISLWDGRAISRLSVPTTRYLTDVVALDGQFMCASGYQGTLLIGNRRGWRVVPTATNDAILTLAALDGKVYYGAEDALWSFDGKSAPSLAAPTPVHWLSALDDALVLSDGESGKLYRAGTLTDLDTIV